MKIISYYVCELCDEEYDSREKAEICEIECKAVVPKFKVGQRVRIKPLNDTGVIIVVHKIINLRYTPPEGIKQRTVGYKVRIDSGGTIGLIEENFDSI